MKKYQKALISASIPVIGIVTASNIKSYNMQKDMLVKAHAESIANGSGIIRIEENTFEYGGTHLLDFFSKIDLGSGRAIKDYLNRKFERDIVKYMRENSIEWKEDIEFPPMV